MATKRLKDDKGKEYDVEVPDEDDGDDAETLWLDEEDIEWLRRKRREESETERKSSQSQNPSGAGGGRVVKIRAKQASQDSPSTPETKRRRTLRLA